MRNDRWSTDAEIKGTLRCFTKDKRAAGLYCIATMGLSMCTTKKDIWSSLAFPEAEKADAVLWQ